MIDLKNLSTDDQEAVADAAARAFLAAYRNPGDGDDTPDAVREAMHSALAAADDERAVLTTELSPPQLFALQYAKRGLLWTERPLSGPRQYGVRDRDLSMKQSTIQRATFDALVARKLVEDPGSITTLVPITARGPRVLDRHGSS